VILSDDDDDLRCYLLGVVVSRLVLYDRQREVFLLLLFSFLSKKESLVVVREST